MRHSLTAAALLAGSFGFVAEAAAQATVECRSRDYQYTECYAGDLSRPQLIHQISSSACILNRSWGYNPGSGYVWVELNQGKGTICYEMAVRKTGPVSTLRLVELSSGKSVALLLNGVGTTSDCVTVDKQIIRQVRLDYYL